MNNFKYRGFSLIELMIVVAILSILATLAIPSYQTYTERARFSEIINAVEPFKIAVALALQEGVPIKQLKNGSYGIPEKNKAMKYIASIEVKHGIITAMATKILKQATYILKPNKDGTEWLIEGTCIKLNLCQQ